MSTHTVIRPKHIISKEIQSTHSFCKYLISILSLEPLLGLDMPHQDENTPKT